MIQDKLSAIAKKYGVNSAVKAVGGISRYIKIMHNDDLSEYYKASQLLPYKMSQNGMSLYIDDLIVQLHGFEDKRFGSIRESKKLGDFRYGSKDYLSYKFTAESHPMKMENGQKHGTLDLLQQTITDKLCYLIRMNLEKVASP